MCKSSITLYIHYTNISMYMPDGYDAVKVQTQFVQPSTVGTQYGVPLIIGTATGYETAEILYYNTYSSLISVFTSEVSPAIYKCAEALNNNGVNQIAVGVYKDSISELYPLIAAEARTHSITSLVVAGFTLDSTTLTKIVPEEGESLIDVCDENDVIAVIVATPPNGDGTITPTTITQLVESISSRNVYFFAHNDPTVTTDIGGAVLGTIEMLAPQVTPQWKPVVCDIDTYFNNYDVQTLEASQVNTIILDYGLSASFTTQLQSAVPTSDDNNDVITDIAITRSIYSIRTSIQLAIINLRKNTTKLGYTNTSLGLIRATIETTLEDELESTNNTMGMISDYDIEMPTLNDISADDRAKGILRNVIISVTLTGEIKTFIFSLVVDLGGS